MHSCAWSDDFPLSPDAQLCIRWPCTASVHAQLCIGWSRHADNRTPHGHSMHSPDPQRHSMHSLFPEDVAPCTVPPRKRHSLHSPIPEAALIRSSSPPSVRTALYSSAQSPSTRPPTHLAALLIQASLPLQARPRFHPIYAQSRPSGIAMVRFRAIPPSRVSPRRDADTFPHARFP